jgi:hypothetical protein
MSRALRSYSKAGRKEVITHRLTGGAKDKGLGYWAAIDALRSHRRARAEGKPTDLPMSHEECQELLEAQHHVR